VHIFVRVPVKTLIADHNSGPAFECFERVRHVRECTLRENARPRFALEVSGELSRRAATRSRLRAHILFMN